MRGHRSIPTWMLFSTLLALAVTPLHAVLVSGTVTDLSTGDPLAHVFVGFTRHSALSGLPAGDPIPVEASSQTGPDGAYSVEINPSVPGVDRVFVFTSSRWHFNQLLGGIESSRHLPTVADTTRPGVVELDLTLGDAPGTDFAIETNRTTRMVLMRDGATHLSTDIYLPARNGPFPAMLYRTPYNKATDNGGASYVPLDYAMVVQDTRGRFVSEGDDRIFYDDAWGENQDGYDTVDWIVAQPWADGRVASFGGSARGTTRTTSAARRRSAHRTCMPMDSSRAVDFARRWWTRV